MDKWLKERNDLLAKCQGIVNAAEAGNRALTDCERQELTKSYNDIEKLDGQIKAAKADAGLVAAIKGSGGASQHDEVTTELFGDRRVKSMNRTQVGMLAERLATKSLNRADGAPHSKSMALEDATDVLVTDVAVQPQRPTGLLDVIPLIRLSSPPMFKFLRQTTRNNNAAPVAPGAVKPTTTLGLVPVESALRVVAHLSEPIDKYLLTDVTNLRQFVNSELQYGLFETVERQILAGTGVAPQLSGIASTSGVQTQAFATDILTTVRSSITKLESLGYKPSAIVLRPDDWETVELSQTSGSGEYRMAASPVDRAAQRLWGVQVVLSNAPEVGDGLLLAQDSVRLYTDGVIDAQWDGFGANFDRNETRLRVESRFEVAVAHPLGVVRFETAAI
ncbi:phage major capsid protein [Williamsia muralis]|uniref:phage major capsid protein n=1 Tax=Williamsia marianensis TaxID=85044 RepID=UPI000DE65CD6|nr:phage major capsid protein [Williamsia marianensis]PVY29921.1 HK97 family phage major capsid protein [Williamsia marianensis]